MDKLIIDENDATAPEIVLSLDELAREGARRMIYAALEVEAHLQQMGQLRDHRGHALVVRNGKARERTVHTGAGSIQITAPRIHDRRTDQLFQESHPVALHAALATPGRSLAGVVLAWTVGDFTEALPVLLGPEAAGFSATTITRQLQVW